MDTNSGMVCQLNRKNKQNWNHLVQFMVYFACKSSDWFCNIYYNFHGFNFIVFVLIFVCLVCIKTNDISIIEPHIYTCLNKKIIIKKYKERASQKKKKEKKDRHKYK